MGPVILRVDRYSFKKLNIDINCSKKIFTYSTIEIVPRSYIFKLRHDHES